MKKPSAWGSSLSGSGHYRIVQVFNLHRSLMTPKTAQEIAQVLSNIAPKDETFEADFANTRVSETNLAKYYLRAG